MGNLFFVRCRAWSGAKSMAKKKSRNYPKRGELRLCDAVWADRRHLNLPDI